MISVLFLGLLIGMQHALEADHVAAVASIAARQSSFRRIITHGAVWGVGHALTLVAFAGAAVLLGTNLGADYTVWLEMAVGGILVILGGHLVYRMVRDRIHFHTHRHGNAIVHFHAHSHRDEPAPHRQSGHDHAHPKGLPFRTLLVGMMHGMAGSAALLILTASSAENPLVGFSYVALFGIGSMLGMAALSAIIALPITYSANRMSATLTWVNRSLQGTIGAATMMLGIWIVYSTLPA